MIRIYITNQKAKESLHLLGVQIAQYNWIFIEI